MFVFGKRKDVVVLAFSDRVIIDKEALQHEVMCIVGIRCGTRRGEKFYEHLGIKCETLHNDLIGKVMNCKGCVT